MPGLFLDSNQIAGTSRPIYSAGLKNVTALLSPREVVPLKYQTISFSVLVSVGVFISGCEQEVVEQVPVVRPIKILTIEGLASGETLEFPGEIDAAENADLSFEVAGRIIELVVREGQEVAAGELVARLDPADYQSQVDQAQADYNAAESTYRRYEELLETGAVAAQDVDVRLRDFEVTVARLETAQNALDNTRLTTPFAGLIALTYVENFSNVQAKQSIALLQDTSSLEVVVNVPEQDWQSARPGLTLAQRTERARPRVVLSAMPDRFFPAVMSEIATTADQVTRTFEARVRFAPPEDVTVLPGMSANVIVDLDDAEEGGSSTFWIPAVAVLSDDSGNPGVWKIDPATMTASRAPVVLGTLSESDVEILGGINLGDRIALSGVHNLREGMQISELAE